MVTVAALVNQKLSPNLPNLGVSGILRVGLRGIKLRMNRFTLPVAGHFDWQLAILANQVFRLLLVGQLAGQQSIDNSCLRVFTLCLRVK